MATSVKSEKPESGDKEVLDVADEPPQGLENSCGIQDTDTLPENKLEEVAGGDTKKAQLAMSPDGGRMGVMLGRRVISFVEARDVLGGGSSYDGVWQGELELRAMEHTNCR
jgi:hypothetical protein